VPEIFSKIDPFYIIDNVHQRNAGAGIIDCLFRVVSSGDREGTEETDLICKPEPLRTARFLLIGIILSPAK